MSRAEYRPYFEVLAVAAVDPSHAERNRQELRRLRRDDDPFAYEMVHVNSFEDAILAALANPDLQAVIIGDGFGFRSRHETAGAARSHSPGRYPSTTPPSMCASMAWSWPAA